MAEEPCDIPGIGYVRKDVDLLEGSGEMLAGCFNLADTEQLWNLYLHDQGTRPVLLQWVADRQGQFGSASLPPSKTFVRASVMEYVTDNRTKTIMLADQPPRVSVNNVSDDTLYNMNCLWYFRRLLLSKPSLFPRSSVTATDWHIDPYDLLHGWKFLAFVWKQYKGDRIPKRKPQRKAAKFPRMYGEHHDVNRDDGEAGLDVVQGPAKTKVIVTFPAAMMTNEEALTIWEHQDLADSLDAETLVQSDLSLCQNYSNSLTPAQAGKMVRLPLDTEDRERLYDYLTKLDGFLEKCVLSEGPPPTPNEEPARIDHSRRLSRLAALADALELSTLEDDNEPDNDTDPANLKVGDNPKNNTDPVALLHGDNALSARTPTLDEAAAALGISSDTRTVPDTSITLEPWQVTGVAWQLAQEELPVHGGLLADDCGLGKTITMLTTILFASKRRAPPYKPTLILCPALVLTNWMDEIQDRFAGSLQMILFHGSRAHTGSIGKKDLIVDTLDDLKSKLALMPTDDPTTACTVVLSSYATWAKRTTTFTLSTDDDDSTRTGIQSLLDFQNDEDAQNPDFDQGQDQETASGRNKASKSVKLFSTSMNDKFARVVCDEGHAIKTIRTRYHQSVSLLAATYTWVISATPMMNNARDLAGYLALLHHANPFPPPPDDACEKAIDEYQQVAASDSAEQAYHILHPDYYLAVAKGGHLSARAGYYALPVIMGLIALSRKMGSWLDPDDTDKGRIGDDIPPMSVTTVDLVFPSRLQKTHDADFKMLVSMMQNKGPDGDGEDGKLDWGMIRHMCLAAFSPKLSSFVASVGASKVAVSKLPDFAGRPDRGLAYFWVHSTQERADTGPLSRFAAAKYLLTDCPKGRYLFHLMREEGLFTALAAGGPLPRFLIFCEQPLTLWLIELICDALSVPMVTIKSTANENMREQAARAFTSPESGVAVLAVTFKVGSCGLNLHHYCSRVVVMEAPRNLNTLWQSCGRVHRIGQRDPQKVWILSQRQTVECYLDWNNCRKAIPQVAAEAQAALRPRLEGAVTDELAKVITAQGTIDEDTKRAVTATTEQRVLEEGAAELLQAMLGQAQGRLHFSGFIKDCCVVTPGPFTPMTPRKPRGKGKRKLGDGDGDPDMISDGTSPTRKVRGPKRSKASKEQTETSKPNKGSGTNKGSGADTGSQSKKGKGKGSTLSKEIITDSDSELSDLSELAETPRDVTPEPVVPKAVRTTRSGRAGIIGKK